MDIFNWLITSSADPTKTSLAVKGTLVVVDGFVLHAATAACAFGLYCLGIDDTWVNGLIDGITNFVFFGTSGIGAIITVVGLLRKIRLGRWSAHQ